MNNLQKNLCVAAVPLSCYLLAILLAPSWGGFYEGLNSDPEYAYLFNALNILNGMVPGHVDHPGTTLQLLGAMVIFITSQFDFSDLSLTEKVLNDPEKYLSAMRYVLNGLILGSWILLSNALVYRTKKIWLLIPFNGGLLATTAIYVSMQRVSSEPLLVSVTLLLGYFLIEHYFNSKSTRLLSVCIGITLAMGLITKINFAPMLLLVFVLDKRENKLIAIFSLMVASILLTFPVWDQFDRMFHWYLNIVTHTGRYGRGEKGIPSVQALYNNFRTIEPALYFPLFTLVVISVFVSIPGVTVAKRKFFLLAFVIIAALIVMTLKHPAKHYLVPAQVYAALIFALLLNGISRIKPFIVAGVIPFLIWFLYISAKDYGNEVESRVAFRASHDIITRKALNLDCKIIPYYRSTSLEYALSFGNAFARHRYADILSRNHPDFVSYTFWSGNFDDFNPLLSSHHSVSRLHDMNTICFIGSFDLTKKIPQARLVHVEGNIKLFVLESRSL